MKKVLAALLTAALVLPGLAQADRYRLSLSTWGSPKHPQVTQFVPKFVELVEERSEGRIRFRTFEGGEMVKQQSVPTAVPRGTVDISLTTLDNWSGRIPEVSVLAGPLWTWSMETSRDNLLPGKPVFDYFDERLRANGAFMIAMFDIGPPVLSTRFKVEKPGDLQGRTMRVYSKGAGQVMQTLGAAPATIGVGEVYSALQRGTVDGAMGGLGGAVGLKHFEVTDYMFDQAGALGTLVHAYVMNVRTFEKLPEDLQKVVMESAAEARNHAQQYMIDSFDELLGQVEDHGNTVIRLKPGNAEWKQWRQALQPLVDAEKKKYPAELVKMIEEQGS